MEDRLRFVELELARSGTRISVAIKLLSFFALALFALWGYTNFFTVPASAKKALEDGPPKEILERLTVREQALMVIEKDSKNILSDLQKADARVAKVEATNLQLSTLLGSLGSQSGEVSGHKWQVTRGAAKKIDTTKVQCPAGQYVSGIGFIKDDAGGACHTCISGVTFRCTPFFPVRK